MRVHEAAVKTTKEARQHLEDAGSRVNQRREDIRNSDAYREDLTAVRGDIEVRGNRASELMARKTALETGIRRLKEQLGFLEAEASRLPPRMTIYADLRSTAPPSPDLPKVLAADQRDVTAVAKGKRKAGAAEREPEREKSELAFQVQERLRQADRGMDRR